MIDKPNILLIMSDQHSSHVLGCYGDPVIRTPHLDRLASRGVLFESTYCPYPLCAPSRMAFMTGRTPSRIGMFFNGSRLASDIPTFAHAMGNAGYETILCGRMHFDGPDQRHGFESRIFPEISTKPAGELVGTNGFDKRSFEISGPGRNHYLLYDEQCTDAACAWLKQRTTQRNARPYCMVVGLVGPHCPFVCPQDLFDHYYKTISLPPIAPDTLHPFSQRYRQRSQIDNLTPEQIRVARAAYYGMVEFDDRQIGRLLNIVDSSEESAKPVVIYTSDHGELAGEHGMWWKYSFYEGSVAVPLIISKPGWFAEGIRKSAPVSLIDLAPTLAAMAHAPPIPQAEGISLLPALEGNPMDAQWEIFSELYPSHLVEGPSGGAARMLRKGEWKCNWYHDEKPELFNLINDPEELHNRVSDPACQSILNAMIQRILRDWDPQWIRQQAALQRQRMSYVTSAPEDQMVYTNEEWDGPVNYGCVFPH